MNGDGWVGGQKSINGSSWMVTDVGWVLIATNVRRKLTNVRWMLRCYRAPLSFAVMTDAVL